jgi:hypothetical protein
VQVSFELAAAALLDVRPGASLNPRISALLARLRKDHRKVDKRHKRVCVR